MSTEGNRARRRVRYRGFSLVETAIFIAVVGIGLAGVLLAITTATRDSVDPLIRKQAVAIAESLLQEITSMPYTYCDPDVAGGVVAHLDGVDYWRRNLTPVGV